MKRLGLLLFLVLSTPSSYGEDLRSPIYNGRHWYESGVSKDNNLNVNNNYNTVQVIVIPPKQDDCSICDTMIRANRTALETTQYRRNRSSIVGIGER